MRNMHLEATIWNLFTSAEFFEEAAQECEDIMTWFGTIAISRRVANFGRNNQIFDKFKTRANELNRGAALARQGDYRLIWEVSECISGDIRGMMEQRLHSWMTDSEIHEFSNIRVGRLMAYTGQIVRALNNAMAGADSFFEPNPDCPERTDDDEGFADDEIAKLYQSYITSYELPFWNLPDPLPEYEIDYSIDCRTGDEVPWTGVWFPRTGLEHHSLTFAIKGSRMQPAYRVTKTKDQLRAEGIFGGSPETVAEATTWYRVVPSGHRTETNKELWAKAGEPCPKAGIWQPNDPGAAQRSYGAGETMANLGSAYGLTVWRWKADR